MSRFSSFREFYPFYLGEHANRTSRRLHFIGSCGVLALVAVAIWQLDPWWLLAALACGYGFGRGGLIVGNNAPYGGKDFLHGRLMRFRRVAHMPHPGERNARRISAALSMPSIAPRLIMAKLSLRLWRTR